jgi:hypothetical protein
LISDHSFFFPKVFAIIIGIQEQAEMKTIYGCSQNGIRAWASIFDKKL